MLVVMALTVLVIACATGVLVRRDRHRATLAYEPPEARRLADAATRGMRDARLAARACRAHGASAAVTGLRGPDPTWRP